MTTIGSLFSGYGGLDAAVERVLGGRTVWHAEIFEPAARVHARHWPGVPNLGDVRRIDYRTVEPVEVLTGGFPCQDVSAAGLRTGLVRYRAASNRSGLWAEFARAIYELRPDLVVIENVRGLLSAKTDPEIAVRACPTCVDRVSGDKSYGMRSLGAVLGDLAVIGYDAAWRVVRACDVGAPHRRERVFVVAWPTAHAVGPRLPNGRRQAGADGGSPALRDRAATRLLPTPSAADGRGGPGESTWRRGGLNLRTAVTLLPTPRASDGAKGGPNQRGSSGDLGLSAAVQPSRWGKYAEAVERWESLTRPAPEPTEPSRNGKVRLAPEFAEWMMGLPAGWVTDPELGLSRREQLHVIGNGVVSAQAELAIAGLLVDARYTIEALG